MIGWMRKDQMVDFLLTISFSLFGMLLIFGLGFVFPTINPYMVIKWIIIVCTVVFAYSVLMYIVRTAKIWGMKKGLKKGGKK